MSAPTALQGLQDILPPPLLAQAETSGKLLILSLLLGAALLLFAWYRYRQQPLPQCRRQYHKLIRELQQLSCAQAGGVLEQILLKRFRIARLHDYPGTSGAINLNEQDWQQLVNRIYQARFSGKATIDLQVALQQVRQLLWPGRI